MKNEKKVRILVGTRKGGFLVEGNAARTKWTVHGPFHEGNDLYHLVADPRHEGHVYACVNSGWVGPMLYRSSDWGHRWSMLPLPALPGFPTVEGRGGEKKPSPIVNLWHVEPGPEDEPNTVFLGLDPASLHRSDDLGKSWEGVSGINEHETRSKWNPGAGGMCLHTILLEPGNPKRMYVGISAAGTFRSDDGGEHWKPTNRGVVISFQPERRPVVGQCVHKVALDPQDPSILYRQDHDGIFVSRDRSDSWRRVGRSLGSDFGFVTSAAPAEPGGAYFVPLQPFARTAPAAHLQVCRYDLKQNRWRRLISVRAWPGEFGTHREALATDALDPAGIYLGTTTGQLILSRDAGKSWSQVPYSFPAIHSVSVAGPSAS